MIIDKDDWKKLKSAIDSIYWDIDRMSSDGERFLNISTNLINKIEKNQNNKVYVVMENTIINDEIFNGIIGVTTSLKDANLIMKNEIKTLNKIMDFDSLNATNINDIDNIDEYDNEWVYEKDDYSYSLYLNGEYNSNNISVSIKEKSLINESKKDKER